MLTTDRYTKAVLTVIAIASILVTANLFSESLRLPITALSVKQAEAQTSADCPAVSPIKIERQWRLITTAMGVGGGFAIFEAKDGVLWGIDISKLMEMRGKVKCIAVKIERQ
jgi:hypothetical protein